MLQARLSRIILYVADMQRQVTFYRDVLGLSVAGQLPDDCSDEFWVTFETGDCTLSLHGGGQQQFGEDAPKFCFFADDVAAEQEHLQQQGVRVSDIREPEPGVFVFDGWDPEGNRFAVESARQASP